MGYPAPAGLGYANLSFSSSETLGSDVNILELVTYPNNPSGELRKPFYNHSTAVHDMGEQILFLRFSTATNPHYESKSLLLALVDPGGAGCHE